MRPIFAGLIVIAAAGILPAQPRAKEVAKTARLGVQTPGVQIPFQKLKAEAELPLDKSSDVTPLDKSQTETISKTLKTGVAAARKRFAGSPDSVWVFTDDKTTLSRIDPVENKIVAEMRLPAGCNSMVYGETSLWVTCPGENRVLRIDPGLNVVSNRIEVSAEPYAIAAGESSIWVYCRKDGKVERIDPKTNKVSKSVELAVPNTDADITVAEGSVWVTMAGFPLTRIDPRTDKVVQQFVGEGGGLIKASQGAIWLTNVKQNTVWRIDPKRVLATQAE